MLNNDWNKRATKKYKILIPMKVHNAWFLFCFTSNCYTIIWFMVPFGLFGIKKKNHIDIFWEVTSFENFIEKWMYVYMLTLATTHNLFNLNAGPGTVLDLSDMYSTRSPSISACTNYVSELSLYICSLNMIFFTFGSKRFMFA